MGLLSVEEDNLDKVRAFIRDKIGPEYLKVFDNLWARDDEGRLERIAESQLIKRKVKAK